MKKLLETSLGNGSETAFVYKGERVMDTRRLPEILDRECNPYITGEAEGVVLYVSKIEYEDLKERGKVD